MKRLGVIFLIAIGFALMSAVYVTKTRAQEARAEVARLERDLQNEQALIRTLEAELAYLSRPERAAQIAQEQLGLRPTDAAQIIALDELVVRAPLRRADEVRP